MIVKGRYAAQIEVDFEYDSRDIRIPYSEFRDRVIGGFVEKKLEDAVGQIFASANKRVNITKLYADVYEVEE